MIGRRVGNWILKRELGRGGMGPVFEDRHVSLPSRAAIKVLAPGLESADSFRQRFRREAELQAQLRHTNVVRVLDYFEDGGHWFLVVDYLDRGSLADHLSRSNSLFQQHEPSLAFLEVQAAELARLRRESGLAAAVSRAGGLVLTR
jgi:serine/threonine protein kinase